MALSKKKLQLILFLQFSPELNKKILLELMFLKKENFCKFVRKQSTFIAFFSSLSSKN